MRRYSNNLLDRAEEEIFPVSEAVPLWAKHEVNDHSTPPVYHMHYGIELVIVCTGALRTMNERHEMVVRAGQVWFNGMWEPHGWEILEPPCEVVVTVCLPRILATLQFDGVTSVNWLHPFLLEPARRPQTKPGREPVLLDIARRVAGAVSEKEPRRGLLLRLLLLESLLALYEKEGIPSGTNDGSLAALAPISRAVELTFASRRMVTCEEAAQTCGLCRTLFNRRFKALMGVPFAKFALRHRVSCAARQIASGDLTLKEIADHWGFTDASHLHRVFVQHFGVAPVQYRARALRARPSKISPERPRRS